MRKISLTFMATLVGVALSPLILALPLNAHQHKVSASGKVGVMIHLNPNDSPVAGKATTTWFMLTRRGGDVISPANCNCRVVAYDTGKTDNKAKSGWIADRLPLSTMSMEGHETGHQAVRTTITFPKAGSYWVVLSGKSKDGSFDPFELKFPVTVRR